MSDIDEVVQVWKKYCVSITDWQELTRNVEPRQSVVGPVYEFLNPLPNRPHESFSIVDMRGGKPSNPHYHINDAIEIYIVLQGEGVAVNGGKEEKMQKGTVVVTPPLTTHYAIPKHNLVYAAINTPPFNIKDYEEISETSKKYKFDKKQYEKLTGIS